MSLQCCGPGICCMEGIGDTVRKVARQQAWRGGEDRSQVGTWLCRDALALHGGERCALSGDAPGADLHDVFPDVEPHLRPEQVTLQIRKKY